MKVKTLFFGQLADTVGAHELMLSDVTDTEALKARLIAAHPALNQQVFLFSVNQDLTREKTPLHDGDEVALLPPFQGG